MTHCINIISLSKEPLSAEYPSILADIMISAWCSAFQGILPNAVIAQYTEKNACTAMFSQILASNIGAMYLAERNSQPVGLLFWLPETEHTVRIEALLTIPEVWGKGIGAALMEHALADIAAVGYSAVRVMPFAENHRAQRFYRKYGFAATGRSHQGDALELEFVLDMAVIKEVL